VAAGRAAIVVAAGASSRMGTPKALLAWDDTTLLGYCARELRLSGAAELVVVLGPDSDSIGSILPDADQVTFAYNLDVASGRSTSISIGAAQLVQAAAVLVQSVDQPCPSRVIEALFAAIERDQADVAVPTFQGRRGHPVCFAGRLLPELRALSEATQGLRAVVQRHVVTEVEVDTEAVVWNLNDPTAYQAALTAAARTR
jgi:molybdenum cofactor cytidylyltransferase